MNKTGLLVQHESCECKCRLNKSVCHSKQKWNHDEWRCEYKKLDDWIPSTCDCECNKACKIKEYLDI